VITVKEPLEVVDAELVGVLEAAVVVGVGLHGVICKMHEAVGEVLEVEGLAAGTEVDVAVHVASEDAIGRGEHGKGTHIEFAAVYEEGLFNVKLYDCSPMGISLVIQDHLFDLGQVVTNFDAAPSVRVFAWFYDPYVCRTLPFKFIEIKYKLFERLVFRRLDVECQGNRDFKRIKVQCPIIVAQIHEERFLVGQMVVGWQSVVN
jgi:hypothetical protein